jgi:hypothetical protein
MDAEIQTIKMRYMEKIAYMQNVVELAKNQLRNDEI